MAAASATGAGQREVARDGLEVLEAQLDADGAAGVALALQVFGHLLGQLGEDGAQLGAVAHGVQVAVEGGLAAHRHRLAVRHHRPVVAAVRGLVQPAAVGCGRSAPPASADRRAASSPMVACPAPASLAPPWGRCR
jgi:hypothetical protein